MKKNYFFLVFFMCCATIYAQTGNKTIYGEIGGPGILSVNFDSRFTHKISGPGFRAGFGAVPLFGLAITVPAGVNYLLGSKNHFLELEGGVSFVHEFANHNDGWFSSDAYSTLFQYAYIGYRYRSKHDFVLRIGFCPVFDNGETLPFVGLSFGSAF